MGVGMRVGGDGGRRGRKRGMGVERRIGEVYISSPDCSL